MNHLLNAADISSKMNPKELATGFSAMDLIGTLKRGAVGGAVGVEACVEWAQENGRRGMPDRTCSQHFGVLQSKGAKRVRG